MRTLTRYTAGLIAAVVLMCAAAVFAQDDAPKSAIEQRLKAQFALTKLTADRRDIVTPGSVVVLQKDGLQMCSTDAKVPITNTYKGGKISWNFGAKMAWNAAVGMSGQKASVLPQRKFVTGEKFWITGYQVSGDNVTLTFVSDPFDDIRYAGQLKFPAPKGSSLSADEVMKMISEVLTADNSSQNASAAPEQSAAAAPQPAFQPVEPPPPPSDAAPAGPKTIELGQTRSQVVEILGTPQKIANLGNKEIDYYPDMKVVFIKGKVTDVQ